MMKGGEEADNNIGKATQKQPDYQYFLKIVITGQQMCGKTSLVNRYVDGLFTDSYVATIGVDFRVKTFETKQKEYVKMEIWDLAGEQRFPTITNSYYRGASGMLFLYDVTDSESFQALERFLNEAEQMGHENLVKVIVGNKADENSSRRKVTIEQAQTFAAENGVPYFETSARDNIGIEECFNHLVELMVDVRKAEQAELAKYKGKEIIKEPKQNKQQRDDNKSAMATEPKTKSSTCVTL